MIHSYYYLYISTVVSLYIVIIQNKQDEVHTIYRIYHLFCLIEYGWQNWNLDPLLLFLQNYSEHHLLAVYCRVGVKYIGTCTYLYLCTFFLVLACFVYLCFKNVLVLAPKYITKYLVLEDKYIASTSRFAKKKTLKLTFSVIQCTIY